MRTFNQTHGIACLLSECRHLARVVPTGHLLPLTFVLPVKPSAFARRPACASVLSCRQPHAVGSGWFRRLRTRMSAAACE